MKDILSRADFPVFHQAIDAFNSRYKVRAILCTLALLILIFHPLTTYAGGIIGKEILRIGKGAITLASMRPDGKAFILGVGNGVTLYDEHFSPVAALEGQLGKITNLAWAKNSTHLVTVDDAGLGMLRDASTGKPIAALKGHIGRINTVS